MSLCRTDRQIGAQSDKVLVSLSSSEFLHNEEHVRPYQRGRASLVGLRVVLRGGIETGRLVGVARCDLIGERKSQMAARDKLKIAGPCLCTLGRTLGRTLGWLWRIRAVRIDSYPVAHSLLRSRTAVWNPSGF
jgi:hypothetical protein